MNETSRAKRLIKLLERLLKKRELYDEDKLKMIKEQLKTAKNELAIIEEIKIIFFRKFNSEIAKE